MSYEQPHEQRWVTAAVSVRGLGKRYHIGAKPGSGSLYDRLTRIGQQAMGKQPDSHPTIWALHDLSFDLQPGNVLWGHRPQRIGQEHADEDPCPGHGTHGGEAVVRGRVGALLQVGTGFHPELFDSVRLRCIRATLWS